MKTKLKLISCFVLIIATVVLVVVFGFIKKPNNDTQTSSENSIDELDSNTIILDDSGIRVTFKDVILSQPNETRKLVVFEQEGTTEFPLSKNVIEKINWKALQKTQTVTYTATGHFVVDLDKLTEESIVDDKEHKVLTIKIEHPHLDSIDIDPDKIIVGDKKNGVLAFGDLEMTVNDYVQIEKGLQKKFKESFDTTANGQEADELALKMVKSIYEPVVKAVDRDYTVQVVFK